MPGQQEGYRPTEDRNWTEVDGVWVYTPPKTDNYALLPPPTKPADAIYTIDRPVTADDTTEIPVDDKQPDGGFASRWAAYEDWASGSEGRGDNLPVLQGGGGGGDYQSPYGDEQPPRKRGGGVVASVALVALIAAGGAGYKLVHGNGSEANAVTTTAPATGANKGGSPADTLKSPSTTTRPEVTTSQPPAVAPETSAAHKHKKASHSPKPETTHPVQPAPTSTAAPSATETTTESAPSTSAPTTSETTPSSTDTTPAETTPVPTETVLPPETALPGDMLGSIERSIDTAKAKELTKDDHDVKDFLKQGQVKQTVNLWSINRAAIAGYLKESQNIYDNDLYAASLDGGPNTYDASSLTDKPSIASAMTANTDTVLKDASNTLGYDRNLRVLDLAYLDKQLQDEARQNINDGQEYTDAQDVSVLDVENYTLKDESEVNLVATWADYVDNDGNQTEQVRWSMPVQVKPGEFVNVTLAQMDVQPQDTGGWFSSFPTFGDGGNDYSQPSPTTSSKSSETSTDTPTDGQDASTSPNDHANNNSSNGKGQQGNHANDAKQNGHHGVGEFFDHLFHF